MKNIALSLLCLAACVPSQETELVARAPTKLDPGDITIDYAGDPGRTINCPATGADGRICDNSGPPRPEKVFVIKVNVCLQLANGRADCRAAYMFVATFKQPGGPDLRVGNFAPRGNPANGEQDDPENTTNRDPMTPHIRYPRTPTKGGNIVIKPKDNQYDPAKKGFDKLPKPAVAAQVEEKKFFEVCQADYVWPDEALEPNDTTVAAIAYAADYDEEEVIYDEVELFSSDMSMSCDYFMPRATEP